MNSVFLGKRVMFNLHDTEYAELFGHYPRTGIVKGYTQKTHTYLDAEYSIETTFKIIEDDTGQEFDVPSGNITYIYDWKDPINDIENFKKLGACIKRIVKETEELKKIAKSLDLVYEGTEDADEYHEWRQPTGSHGSYTKGSKVIHKGEEYISKDD